MFSFYSKVVRALLCTYLAGYQICGADPEIILGPPLFQVTGWDMRSPCVQDLDNDGRKDIVIINNDKGQLDLFCNVLRELEKSRIAARTRPIGIQSLKQPPLCPSHC